MEPDHRISDREREDAVAALRVHTQEGRLTLDELSGRVTEVYKAKTGFDLQFALRELPAAPVPAVQPAMAEAPAPRASASPQHTSSHAPHHRRNKKGQNFRSDLAGFITPNLICILIYLVTMAGGYFWPIWVLIPTGVGFAARVIKGYDEPSPRRSLNE